MIKKGEIITEENVELLVELFDKINTAIEHLDNVDIQLDEIVESNINRAYEEIKASRRMLQKFACDIGFGETPIYGISIEDHKIWK